MSRHRVPNAVLPRGEATRERLISAALALFGSRGVAEVGAREITAAAGTPLSAIPYHFGTKEALYLETVKQVTERLAAALAPAAAVAARALEGSPVEAASALLEFQGALLDVIAVAPESEAWAKLLMREHMDPSVAFDLVYEDAARGAVDLMAALIGHSTRRKPDDPQVLLEAFVRMGEVLMFRTIQAAVVRRLGWKRFSAHEATLVQQAFESRHATENKGAAPPRPGGGKGTKAPTKGRSRSGSA